MGHKKVCFDCRKVFSLGTDFTVKHSAKCPQCGQEAHYFNHKFRPPRKEDAKKWKVVEFLMRHGFIYQHIYSHRGKSLKDGLVEYPETMTEAKIFVKKYKRQAYDL